MKKNIIQKQVPYITPRRYEKILSVLNQRTRFLTVVMENFYDPRNASAILRSCDAFGLQDAHIIELNNPHYISKRVCKGSQFWVNRYRYSSVQGCLSHLKNLGYQVLFADPDPAFPSIEEISLTTKTAVIFGQEKAGITSETKALAHGGFKIPLYGFVESFNVSVACALTLSHLNTKLRAHPPKDFFLSKKEKEVLLNHWLAKNTFISKSLKRTGKMKDFLLKEPYLI